mmetsp:Transcript_123854/g.214710  ORF Transcript_123854/g.214710 Transcript_123854/m.214710 type:complete len:201 (+) Transcript_123854:1008-1610(+)
MMNGRGVGPLLRLIESTTYQASRSVIMSSSTVVYAGAGSRGSVPSVLGQRGACRWPAAGSGAGACTEVAVGGGGGSGSGAGVGLGTWVGARDWIGSGHGGSRALSTGCKGSRSMGLGGGRGAGLCASRAGSPSAIPFSSSLRCAMRSCISRQSSSVTRANLSSVSKPSRRRIGAHSAIVSSCSHPHTSSRPPPSWALGAA